LRRDNKRADGRAQSFASSRLPTRPAYTVIRGVPDEVISSVIALEEHCFVLGNARGQILVTDWAEGTVVTMWSASNRAVTALCASCAQSHIFSGSGAGEVAVWDFAGSKLATLLGHKQEVRSASLLTSNPRRLISGSCDCVVRLWDLTGQNACTWYTY